MDNVNVESVEKECGALGGLFQAIVNDMKVRRLCFLNTYVTVFCTSVTCIPMAS